MVDYTGLASAWVRVRLHCRCMMTDFYAWERSWHRQEVEVLRDDEAMKLIEEHKCV